MRLPIKLPVAALAAAVALVPGARAAAPSTGPVMLSYRLNPGESLRYKLTAKLHGKVPLADPSGPSTLTAGISAIYVATPKTRLADGTMDVDFKVSNVEVEIENLPFPIQDDQAQQVLDQSVTLASTGEVMRVTGGSPAPFSVSVPGVDPKRLYALLFPIVFQSKPVHVGDSWRYKSELLGGGGSRPTFKATLLPTGSRGSAKSPGSASQGDSVSVTNDHAVSLLREEFIMPVDQKVDENHKPVMDDSKAHRLRRGRIDGSGTFTFDRTTGRVTEGDITIRANLRDDLLGKPTVQDEPKELFTDLEAKVRLELAPVGASDTNKLPDHGVDKP